MSFLIAVLTSRDSKKLHRCLLSIPTKYDTKVICNTLNPRYYTKAQNICRKHNVEMIITKSNGTPGKGKNSVLNYFLENTKYDYVILIDGDDYFFPDGVDKVISILTNSPDIDVLGLENCHVVEEKVFDISEYEKTFLPKDLNVDLTYFSKFINYFNTQFNNDNKDSVANFHRLIAYSRRSVKKIKYDESLIGCEDMLFSIQLKKLDENGILNFKLTNCTK